MDSHAAFSQLWEDQVALALHHHMAAWRAGEWVDAAAVAITIAIVSECDFSLCYCIIPACMQGVKAWGPWSGPSEGQCVEGSHE